MVSIFSQHKLPLKARQHHTHTQSQDALNGKKYVDCYSKHSFGKRFPQDFGFAKGCTSETMEYNAAMILESRKACAPVQSTAIQHKRD